MPLFAADYFLSFSMLYIDAAAAAYAVPICFAIFTMLRFFADAPLLLPPPYAAADAAAAITLRHFLRCRCRFSPPTYFAAIAALLFSADAIIVLT